MIHRGGGGQKCLKNCRHGLWIGLHEHKKSYASNNSCGHLLGNICIDDHNYYVHN